MLQIEWYWVIIVLAPLLGLLFWLGRRLQRQREIVEMKLHEKEFFVDIKYYEECKEEVYMLHEEMNSARDPLVDCHEQLEWLHKRMQLHLETSDHHQQALFARALQQLQQYFPEMFLLNLPKNSLGGDFLFVHGLPQQRLLVLLGDSSQVEMAGAITHIFINNVLQEVLLKTKITSPSDFLQQVYQTLASYCTFFESTLILKLSLLWIDISHTKIQFVAEQQRAYYWENQIIKTVKGNTNKMALQLNTPETLAFQTHELVPTPGSYLYLTTNGFADQWNFKGKKVGQRGLQALLTECKNLPPADQEAFLHEKHRDWRGVSGPFTSMPLHKMVGQIDDILILGIRLNA